MLVKTVPLMLMARSVPHISSRLSMKITPKYEKNVLYSTVMYLCTAAHAMSEETVPTTSSSSTHARIDAA